MGCPQMPLASGNGLPCRLASVRRQLVCATVGVCPGLGEGSVSAQTKQRGVRQAFAVCGAPRPQGHSSSSVWQSVQLLSARYGSAWL